MGKVLLIDDDPAFLRLLQVSLNERYPELDVIACNDPIKCLVNINTDLDLMLVDLEMPGLDGSKVLSYAIQKGLSKNRIIILSGRDADYLHERFPMGSCLAVLNKFDVNQKNVLDMVFKSLQKKTIDRDTTCTT